MHSTTANVTSFPLNRSGKPLLIWLAPPLLTFRALIHAIFLFAVVTDDGTGTIRIGSSAVGGAAIWSLVVPVLALGIVVYLAGAYGLLRERLWARPLLVFVPLGLYVLLSAGVLVFADTVVGAVGAIDWTGLIVIGAAYLYLYHYAPARKYFDSLRAESRSSTSAS